MYRVIFPSIIMAAVVSSGTSRNEEVMSLDLREYRWKNRLLFLFAPNRDHPSFDSLHESIVACEAEADDRDLVIFEVLETAPCTVDGDPLDPASAQLLRDRFGAAEGAFSVVLVGKDGGVKLDHQGQIRVEEIFALIDAMPMRQEEMRR